MNAERDRRRGASVPFFVTIDTEEDDWGRFRIREPSLENIRELETVVALLEDAGARPTFLVGYPVAKDPGCVASLADWAERTRGEIGAHCHPWNTPPYLDPDGTPEGTMLCNLPGDGVARKLGELTRTLADAFGERPRAFRAGRWGFGSDVAAALVELGYAVDTSVPAFTDFTRFGGVDTSEVAPRSYRFDPGSPFTPDADGALLEIPATVGFIGRENQERSARIRRAAERSILRRLRVVGLLDRLGIARRRWLSPEYASGEEMIALCETLLACGVGYLNLTFHSTTLLPGRTPFVENASERRTFLRDLEEVLAFAADSPAVRFAALSEGPDTQPA